MAILALKVAARYKDKKKLESGNTVYMYSERQIALRNKKKADRLEKLRGKIKSLRSQVKKDLRSDDPETALTALAVALADHTFERVGNEASAKGERTEDGEKHYGITTFLKDHVSFKGAGATISYVGKSGVKQKKSVTDASIVRALKNAYARAEADSLFSPAGGKVDAGKVNAYLKKFDITAKDLRGFHANRLMQENLRKVRGKGGALREDPKKREAQLKKELKKALELTAAAVAH